MVLQFSFPSAMLVTGLPKSFLAVLQLVWSLSSAGPAEGSSSAFYVVTQERVETNF